VAVLVMIDGRICAPEEQVISVFDRGFLYGDSVFETLRTYGGVPFELGAHLARLEQSARRVFIPLPLGLAELADEVRRAVAAASNAESYVRLIVTRGQGVLGLDPALAEHPRRVILITPLNVPPPHFYIDGVAAVTQRTQRVLDATGMEGAKIGNYLVSVLAMREAKRAGAAEALIVDGAGRVLEGASSNVFLVTEGRLITPPLEAGILAGITRAQVLEVAAQTSVEVTLLAPDVEQAYAADELFITSSIRELVPVVRLDGRTVGTGKPGPVFRRLLAAFRERVRAGVRDSSV
jgi:branched-chain amino acid aminotransferase